MTFEEIIHELNARKGQGTVADLIGMDPTKYCRIVSGQGGGFKSPEVDALLKLRKVKIVPENHEEFYLKFALMCLDMIEALRKEYGIGIGVEKRCPENQKF